MDWIRGDTSITLSILIDKANKWYKMLHKRKVWNKLSKEQAKIILLSTQLARSNNQIKELKTQVQAYAMQKGKGNNGGRNRRGKP